ncbi:MAG: hypothetical protein ABSF43_11475 [Rectinemataceae bacterium]|jgi:hypothetical protein
MKRFFDRERIEVRPLAERRNKLDIERDLVDPGSFEALLSPEARSDVAAAAAEVRTARSRGAAVILAFGAHSIKNGLSRVLARLMEGGWVSHFATNGAGVIHDWEFAYQGRSGEDVKRYVAEGQFGIWEETGSWINLALAVGAWRGMGYGESVGAMIAEDGLELPSEALLAAAIRGGAEALSGAGANATANAALIKAAAAADLLALMKRRGLNPGRIAIEHPFKRYSLAAAAYSAQLPFTCHPMFGHDIIYTHPMSSGAAIGRTAEPDFLSFADSVSRLEGGVYLSVGSAVMSPMIFEKALSMARNAARREGRKIEDFAIHVVDLATSTWDWASGVEPAQDDPAYYLRYCKTFSRMGGRMSYASADNRSWLVALLAELEGY